jgi:hypothetical protein
MRRLFSILGVSRAGTAALCIFSQAQMAAGRRARPSVGPAAEAELGKLSDWAALAGAVDWIVDDGIITSTLIYLFHVISKIFSLE